MKNTENTENTENAEVLALAKNEIEEIVRKYNISLVPVIMHHGDKTFSRIDIVSASNDTSEK
jgi:hypothetical protein